MFFMATVVSRSWQEEEGELRVVTSLLDATKSFKSILKMILIRLRLYISPVFWLLSNQFIF